MKIGSAATGTPTPQGATAPPSSSPVDAGKALQASLDALDASQTAENMSLGAISLGRTNNRAWFYLQEAYSWSQQAVGLAQQAVADAQAAKKASDNGDAASAQADHQSAASAHEQAAQLHSQAAQVQGYAAQLVHSASLQQDCGYNAAAEQANHDAAAAHEPPGP